MALFNKKDLDKEEKILKEAEKTLAQLQKQKMRAAKSYRYIYSNGITTCKRDIAVAKIAIRHITKMLNKGI